MKKYFFALSAATLALASCSNEEMPVPTPGGGDGTVTFTASIPSADLSRYGEGDVAKQLHYAVYETGTTEVVFASDVAGSPVPAAVDSRNFSLTLQLVKGKTYDFIFWADAASDSPYTFSSADQSVSVDYTTPVAANDENRDAFFQSVTGIAVSGPMRQSVELRRPFAQLNVGTSDLKAVEAAKAEIEKVDVTVTEVYATLNLLSGVASDAQTVTFSGALPTGQAFPVEGYDYLSMDYLLTGAVISDDNVQTAQRELKDATITATYKSGETATVEVPQMPVQRNYRTNIYGALLTSPLDLTITVVPDFYTPDNSVEPGKWDGTITTPEPDEQGNYTITSGAELAGLAQLVNDGTDVSASTIKLTSDIDLDGKTWTSIGKSTKRFNGTFDGNGHSITGLTKTLFGYVSEATIKDVIVSGKFSQSALITQTYGNVKISGVTTEGAVSGYGAGGLVYFTNKQNGEGIVTVENCVNKAEIKDTGYVGGGIIARTACPVTIKNSKNYGKVISNRRSQGKAAGIVGMPADVTIVEDCTNYGDIEVNTSSQCAAGGIVGWLNGQLTITGSSNEGNIIVNLKNPTELSVAGGIYGGNGWGTGPKVFTGCKNTGNVTINVTGASKGTEYQYGMYAGSIIGTTSYDDVNISNCQAGGNISVTTDGAQSQYIGGLAGALGWNTSVTMEGNTINSTLSGNQGEYTRLNALFFALSVDDKVITTSDNTNNTAYNEISR